MKTSLLTFASFALFALNTNAQDITTVNAKNSDISDNLDLRAVASLFGDSEDLQDFERRLNDPKNRISNLDLNNDGRVDYLRIIESVEKGTHLIIIQSVLDRDVFQDVATVEVERDSNNQVQVQVVGDVYMYGQNYIYEPVYVQRPVIYNTFWVGSYSPYYSPWYWNYYPVYYTYWAPYPIYTYRRHIHQHINVHHHYNYANHRRSSRAVAMHSTRRANGYESQHPNRSFTQRNNVTNRYELEQTRSNSGSNRTVGTTANSGVRNTGTRTSVRGTTAAPDVKGTRTTTVRSTTAGTRATVGTRANTRTNSGNAATTRTDRSSNTQSTQRVSTQRVEAPRTTTRAVTTPRTTTRQAATPVRNSSEVSRNNSGRSQQPQARTTVQRQAPAARNTSSGQATSQRGGSSQQRGQNTRG